MYRKWLKPPSGVSIIKGGITAVPGVRAAGVRAGIKERGADLALAVSDAPARFCSAYTTNKVRAACIARNLSELGPELRAVLVNAGNANACTGARGLEDASAMAARAAARLGVDPSEVLLAQTGVIGRPMPMALTLPGIDAAVDALSPDGGDRAAEAIMTTDTVPKSLALRFAAGGRKLTIGGMAKGVGMIEPMMATMLAFAFTDARIPRARLDSAFRAALDSSFHILSVDGDRSTNDAAVLAANGLAGNEPLKGPDLAIFNEAVRYLFRALAFMMVLDGEGATRLVWIKVSGARTRAEARAAARAVGNSNLVKTAMFGADPNWGRVVAAAGYSGAEVKIERTDLSFGDVPLLVKGAPQAPDPRRIGRVMAARVVPVNLDLNLGRGEAEFWTCDLSYKYVEINAEYHT